MAISFSIGLSNPQDAEHLTAMVGDSIVFNCHIEFPEAHPVPYVIQWEKKVFITCSMITINDNICKKCYHAFTSNCPYACLWFIRKYVSLSWTKAFSLQVIWLYKAPCSVKIRKKEEHTHRRNTVDKKEHVVDLR